MQVSTKTERLKWPALIPGTLVKRYKRFLADVRLVSGEQVTAHCPNSGSMRSCCEAGRTVYLSHHTNSRRKLPYTWQLIDMPTSLVGINTLVPNRLAYNALTHRLIPGLGDYDQVRREVPTSAHTRLDLCLSREERDICFIEIKNCTLVHDGVAAFPDAVTHRGRKHLQELVRLTRSGLRCIMLFLIQRMDACLFQPADHIDPAYGQTLRAAVDAGVEILVYDVKITLEDITLNNQVPIQL